MPDIDLDDVTLHYELSGEGPPLLMLAGMLSDSASWGPLVPLLEPHFTLIRPDNRTTGRTRPLDAPVSIAAMARDAAHLLEHLNITGANVLGHSMGGLMALELAGLHTPRRMCIMATAPVRMPRTMAVFDALCAIRKAPDGETLWLRALFPWLFAQDFFLDPDNVTNAIQAAQAYPHAQALPAMMHQTEALRSYRPTIRPADVTCPMQVLLGAEDILIPQDLAQGAFSKAPDARVTIIPKAGHSLHWDAPEAVAQTIRDFLI